MDSIKVLGKTYQLKGKLTFGEVMNIDEGHSDLLAIMDNVKLENPNIDKIAGQMASISIEQRKLIASLIIKYVKITKKDFENLEFTAAMVLFNELYIASTNVKKK